MPGILYIKKYLKILVNSNIYLQNEPSLTFVLLSSSSSEDEEEEEEEEVEEEVDGVLDLKTTLRESELGDLDTSRFVPFDEAYIKYFQ